MLKATKDEQQVTYNDKPIKIAADLDLSADALKIRYVHNNVF
jgi:hypothetical protein